jgi:hypothetical protein
MASAALGGFDRSIARLNAAVASHLTNADAALDGHAVRVVFDNGTRQFLGGIDVQTPNAGLPSAQAAHATQDSVLRIVGGEQYRVVDIKPDGAGWTELTLQLLNPV